MLSSDDWRWVREAHWQWLGVLRKREPLDLRTAQPVVDRLYAVSGLPAPRLLVVDEAVSAILIGHHLKDSGMLPPDLEALVPEWSWPEVIGHQRPEMHPFPVSIRFGQLFIELLSVLKREGISERELKRVMGPLRNLYFPVMRAETRACQEARRMLDLWNVPRLWFPWGGESVWAYYLPPLQLGARLKWLSAESVLHLAPYVDFMRLGVWAFLPLEGLLILVNPPLRKGREARPDTLPKEC